MAHEDAGRPASLPAHQRHAGAEGTAARRLLGLLEPPGPQGL